ncbi:MAG TPA: Fur family transcriptional regulator [Myxococcales bacterium]|jgi:Fur family ferric uptake transcriptional regulator
MRTNRNRPEAEERFREVLKEHGLRWTAERGEILEAVVGRAGHFTVDELARRLRQAGCAASRATVYRALPLLVEAGLVQPMVLGGEVRRYESALAAPHHDHLVCTSCGKVVEFQFEAFEMLQREVAAQHGFRLRAHVHELFGLCRECQQAAGEGEVERGSDVRA